MIELNSDHCLSTYFVMKAHWTKVRPLPIVNYFFVPTHLARKSDQASSSLLSLMFTNCIWHYFSETKRHTVMKLQTCLHHDIVSATLVSFIGECLTVTFLPAQLNIAKFKFTHCG